MKVELLNNAPSLKEARDLFVNKHNLLFSSGDWLGIYPADNLRQAVILNNNNEVIGCFNYYEYNRALLRFIITPPFSPNIGLFYINPAVSVVGKNSFNKDLVGLLADYFGKQKTDLLDIQLPLLVQDVQPFIWAGMQAKARYTYLLDLRVSQDQLWEQLSSEKRKSISKAQKDGIVIGQSSDFDQVHRLVVSTLERSKVHKNAEVLKNIMHQFSKTGNCYAFVASKDKQVLGASFCVVNDKVALYLFGGAPDDNKHHGAGVSCMWHSILKARQMQLNTFDFEGSMNPGIERYFREFGGMLTPYFSIEKQSTAYKLARRIKK